MATTGTLVEWLAAGVKTTAGAAVASGKVRFYQPGTLTPQSVYSDSACTSAITQPVTLSAGGTSIVYTNAAVRMIAKDSTDTTTLFDVTENVQRDDNTFVTSPSFNSGNEVALSTILDAWATTGGGGSTVNWGYKQSGTATDRALKAWMSETHVSVKDFGAVGDGAANDTAALQAALDVVKAAGGGIVFLPAGVYSINAALTISSATGVAVVGAGIGATTIKASGGAQNAFTLTSLTSCIFDSFNVSHSTTSTGKAFSLAAGTQVTWRQIGVNAGNPGSDVFTGGSIVATGVCNYLRVLDDTVCGNISITGSAVSTNFVISDVSSPNGTLTIDGTTTLMWVSCSQFATINLPGTLSGTLFYFVGNRALSLNIGATSDLKLWRSSNDFPDQAVSGAVGGTLSPQPLFGVARLTASSGGAGAITVNLPTTPITTSREVFYLIFVNASGGAVTWNLNAAYKPSTLGPIGSTNGHTTVVAFQFDIVNGGYREISRTESVT